MDTPETGGMALKFSVEQGLESMVALLLGESICVDSSLIGLADQHGYGDIAVMLREYVGGSS